MFILLVFFEAGCKLMCFQLPVASEFFHYWCPGVREDKAKEVRPLPISTRRPTAVQALLHFKYFLVISKNVLTVEIGSLGRYFLQMVCSFPIIISEEL